MEYANVTVRDLLVHLTRTYDAITFTQLDLSLAQLDVEFNPDEPMEVLWKRIKDCRRFAADSQDPISEVSDCSPQDPRCPRKDRRFQRCNPRLAKTSRCGMDLGEPLNG
jgi:hypothetical protein